MRDPKEQFKILICGIIGFASYHVLKFIVEKYF